MHNPLYINALKAVLTCIMMLVTVVCHAQTLSNDDNIKKLEAQAEEYRQSGEPIKYAQTLSKLALIYAKQKNYEKAIADYKLSASLYLQNQRFNYVRTIYQNIGFLYSDQEEYENALTYMKMALKTARLQNNDTAISGSQTDVAYILMIEKEYHVAIDQLLEALKKAQDLNHKQLVVKCYSMLMECYRALGMNAKYAEYQTKLSNYTNHISQEVANREKTDLQIKNEAGNIRSADAQRIYELEMRNAAYEKQMKDSLMKWQLMQHGQSDQENQRALLRVEKERNTQREDELRQQHETLQAAKEAQKQFRIYLTLGGFGLLLLLIIAFLMWRNSRKTSKMNAILQENNRLVEERNREMEESSRKLSAAYNEVSIQKQSISDSISYAKHIQMSMLINKNILKKEIPQMAIFFKPRDVVSGDFYWFHRKGKKTYLAAIDCTGHGVPGAMISMIGYNILENIMANTSLEHPNEIMDKMHMEIRKTLRQDTTENHDGMDMSLCMIDKKNKLLEYCGAKNALVIARPNQEAIKIKPNTFGIGGLVVDDPQNPNPTGARRFTNVDIPVYDDATYYIFSDGFSDQFGGPDGKKYMLGRFRKFLSSICHLPMQDQEMCMKMELKNWKGNMEQTDDILLIGFKV